MKRLLMLLCVASFIACEKNEPQPMEASSLPGTYWKMTEFYPARPENGETNLLAPTTSLAWGRGPRVLLFKEGGDVVQYQSIPSTGHNVTEFYVKGVYDYATEESRLYMTNMSDLARDDDVVKVIEWTEDRLELYVTDSRDRFESRRVFIQFRPTVEWLKMVATWPDYDTLPEPYYDTLPKTE